MCGNEKIHQGLGLQEQVVCWEWEVRVSRRRTAMPNSIAGMFDFVEQKGSQSTPRKNSRHKTVD